MKHHLQSSAASAAMASTTLTSCGKTELHVHLPPLIPCHAEHQHHKRENKSPAPDKDHSPRISRRSNFKNRFVEVYVGVEVFEGAGLNVVVAIYLQATDRLYEVVLINKETAEEISRLYVFEDELLHQMEKRHDALIVARDTHAAWARSRSMHNELTSSHPVHDLPLDKSLERHTIWDETTVPLSSPGQRQEEASVKLSRRKSFGDVQTAPTSHTTKRERRKSLLPVFNTHMPSISLPHSSADTHLFDAPLKDSTSSSSSSEQKHSEAHENDYHGRTRHRKSLVELHHELLGHSNEVRLLNYMDGTNSLLKEQQLATLLAGEKVNCRTMSGHDNCTPVSYFCLKEGAREDPDNHAEHLQKIKRSTFINDDSLLDSDISAASVQDISFFTAVILTSLYVRHRARKDHLPELQFLLFDVDSASFFETFLHIPPNVNDTFPTSIKPQAVLDMLVWNESLKTDEKEISVVKTLVASAQELESLAHEDLHHLHHYTQSDNVNPNKKRLRNMWQSSIATVTKNIGVRKEIRQRWGSVIEQKLQEKEREALLKQHGKEGLFRPLAIDKDWRHLDSPLTPGKIIDYHAGLRDCKRHHMAIKHHSKEEIDAQERQALARRVAAFRSAPSLSSASSSPSSSPPSSPRSS